MMKTALVTAGASGIGAAIAAGLQADGWAVHVCDVDELALQVIPGLARDLIEEFATHVLPKL